MTSGSIRLSVDPSTVFFLDAESASGSVRSDLPMRRDAGRARQQATGPKVRIRTLSGSIHITPR